MSKYGLLLAIAVLIDALQAILGWTAFAIGMGLEFITPAGGGAAGAAAGAYACFDSTKGIITAVAAATKCAVGGAVAGALISTFGIPLGTVLGFVLEMVVSLTLGSALIVLMWFLGVYSRTSTTIGWIVEMIPGLDIIPGWTFMVIMCILKKEAKDGVLNLKGKNSAAKLANMVMPGTALGTAVGGITYMQRQKNEMMLSNGMATEGTYKQMRAVKRQNIKTELQNIDGIKPAPKAPDTKPYVPKAA